MTKFMAFCMIALVASLLYLSYTHEPVGRETLTFNIDIPTPANAATNTTTNTTYINTTYTTNLTIVEQPMSEYYRLNEDVQLAPYTISDYKLHEFDCTNMAALMETHLTKEGWDARILVLTGSGITGHAVVKVYSTETNATYIIECTSKRISPLLANKYKLEGEYNNIIDATENSRWGASEWGLELYLQERENVV